jgi:hypothetical protein
MNESGPNGSLDPNKGLSPRSSTGQSSNEKREVVDVQAVGDEERVPIVDSSDSVPDGGARAWSAIAGAYVPSDIQRKLPSLTWCAGFYYSLLVLGEPDRIQSFTIGRINLMPLCSYINSFGVYQDFYVRKYLTGSTPSEIGYNHSLYPF